MKHTEECDLDAREYCVCGADEISHTPTPWKMELGPDYIAEIIDENGRHIANAKTAAKAERIVRAVNSHEELLSFLTGGCPHSCSDGECPFDRKVRDLIAKVEGK